LYTIQGSAAPVNAELKVGIKGASRGVLATKVAALGTVNYSMKNGGTST